MSKKNKLAMVPATTDTRKPSAFAQESAAQAEAESKSNLSLIQSLAPVGGQEAMPEGLERVGLPPLLRCGDVPGTLQVGATVSGVLVGLIGNFTGQEKLKHAYCLHLKHSGGTEFMLPLSGSIKQAFRPFLTESGKGDEKKLELKPEIIGDMFYFTRLPDGKSKNFGGKNFFGFDIKRLKKDNLPKQG